MADEKHNTVDEKDEGVQIPLHFNFPIGMPSVYATNVVVQKSEQEVIINFFELQLPFADQSNTDEMEMLKRVGLRADIVSKVTVSAKRFKEFARVFNSVAEGIEGEE